MSDSRFAADRSLSARMLSVMLLLFLLYAAAMAILVLLLGRAWPLGVAVVVGFAYFQIRTSGRLAMTAVGAREVTPQEEPELHAVVDRLCALADTGKPRVAVVESGVPNAFAVGRSKKATALCVTRGLLDGLEPTELEGVVAHELAHVAHGDAAVMTVASFLGVLAGMAARVGLKLFYIGGRARGLWHFLAAALGVLILSAATWFASLLLTRSLSRYREFAADRAAAELTGNPAALAAALSKVDAAVGGGGGIPLADLRKAAPLNALYFCPVVAAKTATHHLLSTHPTTQARIAKLGKLSVQLGK